jgi:hypothetical protein
MKKAGRAHSLNLSWDEIGFLCEGLSLASRPMGLAVRAITEEYSLGPRGAWITILIGAGQVFFPLDLTNVFQIGRSLRPTDEAKAMRLVRTVGRRFHDARQEHPT